MNFGPIKIEFKKRNIKTKDLYIAVIAESEYTIEYTDYFPRFVRIVKKYKEDMFDKYYYEIGTKTKYRYKQSIDALTVYREIPFPTTAETLPLEEVLEAQQYCIENSDEILAKLYTQSRSR